LADNEVLAPVGGAGYIASVVDAVVPGTTPTVHARKVRDAARRRRLLQAGQKIAQLALVQTANIEDAVDLAQQVIFELSDRHPDADAPTVYADLLQPMLDAVEAVGAAVPALGADRVLTGFEDMDRLLNGLWPGQLIVVGSRPGVGKTTFAYSVLRYAAIRQNKAAVLFTREDSRLEVPMRIAAAEGRIPLHVLRSGMLTDDDWTKLARCLQATSDAPLFIDDRVRTIAEIRAKARRLRDQYNLELIVVDYIQLFARGFHDRYREISDVTRDLKDLARELGIPIIAVSQLNRGPEQRTDRRPQLVDLRDSGTVEDDADVVILLHRDDYYAKESPRAGEADLIVAKHRHGPTDTVTVAAQLHLARFVDMAVS
jgi:replicative DNA helicase